MFLTPSSLPASTGSVFFSDPGVHEYRDAIYASGHNYFDGLHGVFSREGFLIPQAAFHHQMPPITKHQPQWIDPVPARLFPVIDRAIFVGQPHPQYGHFITEFISRLWALRRIRRDEKLLVRSVPAIGDLFAIPWARELFELLELTPDDFIQPRTSFVVRELVVPTPSFVEDCYASTTFAAFCHRIGDRAEQRSALGRELRGQNLYLTRSGLICGTTKVENEAEFDAELVRRGFRVIHPERLGIPDQICLFRHDNIVTGIVGSAFHTSIFTPSPRGVALNTKAGVSLNYLTMDGANEAEIEYLDIRELRPSAAPDVNYYQTVALPPPSLVADELAERVSAKRTGLCVPNMGRRPTADRIAPALFRLLTAEGHALKFDSRTGHVSSAEFHLFTELALVSLDPDPLVGPCFLMSASDDALPFRLIDGDVYAPAMPVRLRRLGGSTRLEMLQTGCLLDAAPLAEGGLARSASSDLTERTRIDLIERTERIRHGSARARLLAVIAMVFGLVDARHAEFYTSLHPELVAFAHRMRSLHERRTAPRAGSVDTA